MTLPIIEDEFDNTLKFYTGLGANGVVGFSILQPDNVTPKNLTGLTIKLRILANDEKSEVLAALSGDITAPLSGAIEFNMLSSDILTADIQRGAVVVFLNSTTAEEVGEKARADIEEGGNDGTFAT